MPYIGRGLSEGRRQVRTYTATASQTTFAADYDPGYVDVYQNGIRLFPGDYTATSGSDIVLTVAANASDEITIVSHDTFSVANVGDVSNTYIQAQGYGTGDVSNTYIQAQGYGTGDVSNTYVNAQLDTKVDETHTGNVSITGTIEDTAGDVRKAPVTSVTSTPYTVPSGSSGLLFKLASGSTTINVNSANFNEGDIVTLVNIQGTTRTLSFDAWANGVQIAGGDGTNYSSSTLTLAAYGVATLIAIAGSRLTVNGNVS